MELLQPLSLRVTGDETWWPLTTPWGIQQATKTPSLLFFYYKKLPRGGSWGSEMKIPCVHVYQARTEGTNKNLGVLIPSCLFLKIWNTTTKYNKPEITEISLNYWKATVLERTKGSQKRTPPGETDGEKHWLAAGVLWGSSTDKKPLKRSKLHMMGNPGTTQLPFKHWLSLSPSIVWFMGLKIAIFKKSKSSTLFFDT